jgi:hydrogenase expression/formation protein HypE
MKILLSHGSGGRLTHELIKGLLLKHLGNPVLNELSDSAYLGYQEKLAFTTDSFVVSPLEFSGGDIGKLAVCGTVNDLVMQAAVPEYLSLALIIEEGLELKVLEKIVKSIAAAAEKSGVKIVTGDLKVVEKGACDKIFINTSGIGRILPARRLSVKSILPGDRIIITGNIAQHGLAILAKRKELDLGLRIKSDCAGLGVLLIPVLKQTRAIRFMRDPTRGGVATTLNEIADSSGLGIVIREKDIPVSASARAACELLGIDPLYLANEGRALIIAGPRETGKIVDLLRRHALGRGAKEIGAVVKGPRRRVILRTALGTQRVLEMLSGDPLPRIC